jgi:hypothetical protein
VAYTSSGIECLGVWSIGRNIPSTPGWLQNSFVASTIVAAIPSRSSKPSIVKPLDTVEGMKLMRPAFTSGFSITSIRSPSVRSRRPPLDNLNALLSFLYTLLTHDVAAALEGVGLDPAVGYLHRDRPGHPSLALDLVEELRPVIADRLTLSLTGTAPAPRIRPGRSRRVILDPLLQRDKHVKAGSAIPSAAVFG